MHNDHHDLSWIGEHAYADTPSRGTPGMRDGISLTAIRGIDTSAWLDRLGAVTTGTPVAYRDYTIPDDVEGSLAMVGTSGGWSFVLEDGDAATVFLSQFDNDDVLSREGEEMVCLTLNRHDAPAMILYSSPADDRMAWSADFGTAFLDGYSALPEDTAARLSVLDDRLAAYGAVHARPAPPARPWSEMGLSDWAPAVYRAVGCLLGIRIDRDDVEQGQLPAVVLPEPV
ncbi:hypothetical protein ACFVYR_36455 [Streptomyces sp. NPDC058284]|uniref:hypothetical protein n=1 Tax=unclassified Streptomyces TaxID=2593676 RepID=UPI00365F294A